MSELETKFWFDWEIPKELLHSFYFKHYTKENNDYCMSSFYTHKYTQTIWALCSYPYGDNNSRNDNESKIYLNLINKPSEMKSVTINAVGPEYGSSNKFFAALHSFYVVC